MRSAIGDPSVLPWRMPDMTWARSFSIFMRPPRPWPSWRRARSWSMSSGARRSPAGSPSRRAIRPGPWDSPAVVKRRAMALKLAAHGPPKRPPQGGRALEALGDDVEERAGLGLDGVALLGGSAVGLVLGRDVLYVALVEDDPLDRGQRQVVALLAVERGQRGVVAVLVHLQVDELAALRR